MNKHNLPENAKLVFKWKIFDVYQWEQVMFDWTIKTFEKIKRNDTIDVIAISEDWRICIVEEEQPWRTPFYWLVWGTCEDWEDHLGTAQRELLEETWMVSENWELFNSYKLSSKIDYKSHIYIARNCSVVKEQQLDPGGEKIQIKLVQWKEFLDIIADSKFKVSEFALEVLRYIYLWKEEELKELIFKESTDQP